MSSGAVLLPLGAGFGYACGAIVVKRALGAGVSGPWVVFVSNVVMAILFQMFWLLPERIVDLKLLLLPAGCGLLFLLGQIFTFRAIALGDVSVVTPLLGLKVILVALFSVCLFRIPLPASWWWASLLASIGIALISYTSGGSHQHSVLAVGWSLGAAIVFALTDVFVQKWVPEVGYGIFAPMMFGTTGIFSFLYLPHLLKSIRARMNASWRGLFGCPLAALPWLAAGTLLLAVQSVAMYSAIGLYGSATITNILYGSRCLWSVLLAWALGSFAGEFAAPERRTAIMARRFTGALFLFGAMTLVLR